MNQVTKLLRTFEFNGWSDLTSSLMPSLKYHYMTIAGFSFSSVSVITFKVLGLDVFASIAFVCVMLLEVLSGLRASHKTNVAASSTKMSRFSLKLACYCVVLFVCNSFAESFEAKGGAVGAWFFSWLHLFSAIHIATENIFSIMENWAIIEGKDKTFYITKVQNKINKIFE